MYLVNLVHLYCTCILIYWCVEFIGHDEMFIYFKCELSFVCLVNLVQLYCTSI